MTTFSDQVTVEDAIGLHARPAGQIVKLVKEIGLEIRIGRPGEKMVRANSPLGLMALKVKPGEVLAVEIDVEDGVDGKQIVDHIQAFLRG